RFPLAARAPTSMRSAPLQPKQQREPLSAASPRRARWEACGGWLAKVSGSRREEERSEPWRWPRLRFLEGLGRTRSGVLAVEADGWTLPVPQKRPAADRRDSPDGGSFHGDAEEGILSGLCMTSTIFASTWSCSSRWLATVASSSTSKDSASSTT